MRRDPWTGRTFVNDSLSTAEILRSRSIQEDDPVRWSRRNWGGGGHGLIHLEGLRKVTENFDQKARCPSRFRNGNLPNTSPNAWVKLLEQERSYYYALILSTSCKELKKDEILVTRIWGLIIELLERWSEKGKVGLWYSDLSELWTEEASKKRTRKFHLLGALDKLGSSVNSAVSWVYIRNVLPAIVAANFPSTQTSFFHFFFIYQRRKEMQKEKFSDSRRSSNGTTDPERVRPSG